jgi:hypothetical protein
MRLAEVPTTKDPAPRARSTPSASPDPSRPAPASDLSGVIPQLVPGGDIFGVLRRKTFFTADALGHGRSITFAILKLV